LVLNRRLPQGCSYLKSPLQNFLPQFRTLHGGIYLSRTVENHLRCFLSSIICSRVFCPYTCPSSKIRWYEIDRKWVLRLFLTQASTDIACHLRFIVSWQQNVTGVFQGKANMGICLNFLLKHVTWLPSRRSASFLCILVYECHRHGHWLRYVLTDSDIFKLMMVSFQDSQEKTKNNAEYTRLPPASNGDERILIYRVSGLWYDIPNLIFGFLEFRFISLSDEISLEIRPRQSPSAEGIWSSIPETPQPLMLFGLWHLLDLQNRDFPCQVSSSRVEAPS